jgi:hypothetical protein
MKDYRLHSADVILTREGRTACSLCGHFIKEEKTSRNTTALLEWQSVEVMGLFCSEKCAEQATADEGYRRFYSFKEGK